MKKYFIVSLIKGGIPGGGMSADSEALIYHTGKLTVPEEYRHLVMKYTDIREVTSQWLFILPTVLIRLKNGEEYKFAVFFGRQRLLDTLKSMGVRA